MRTQLAPQASMQMRRGTPRGMAPTRNVSASPQATVHRPSEEVYSAVPQSRRPPENSMQRRAAPPTYGKSDIETKQLRKFKKMHLPKSDDKEVPMVSIEILVRIQQIRSQLEIQTLSVRFFVTYCNWSKGYGLIVL